MTILLCTAWIGHRELLGRAKQPIVDVDEVLRVFGTTRRSARAAYVRRLKGAVQEDWIGEEQRTIPHTAAVQALQPAPLAYRPPSQRVVDSSRGKVSPYPLLQELGCAYERRIRMAADEYEIEPPSLDLRERR